VLFVTYRRFDFLEHAVRSFRQNTRYPKLELVIADDGSGPEVQARIRALPADRFALSPANRGLGANNNSGLSLCSGKYILMIQDDWLCHGPADYLANAVAVLEANPDVGIINFAGANHPRDLAHPLKGSSEPCYITRQTMKSHKEEFLYSDQPHIRSRAALQHVGPYLESRDMEKCETDYCERWKQQTRFLTAVFPAYYFKVFSDEGAAQGISHRLNMFRYRAQRGLWPAARWLQRHCRPVYAAGRWMLNVGVSVLENLKLVR
jgi:glycosyltransferase involved in cell wall biosynthesis